MRIVLASGSVHRRKLLADAGIRFDAVPSTLDERALEAPLRDSGATPEDVALVLAEAKASEVAEREPGALVIGADQTLSLGTQVFHKPVDMEEARRALLQLSGRTHRLNSAVVLAENGTAVWRHVSVASLTMRELTPAAVGRYLAEVGPAALTSVGCYQIEGAGVRLMDRVEGDFWTIVGLPLLPLLAELRRRGAVED
ncbi:Maf-like protein [Aureimonas leprariae]|uniref:Nucleoside triphosphate pyrophosphatase n=1 Tax=Plantimonas leprariae TaxID=2615207 RepID=A0A7V7PNI3_9HYPH|nr:Maf-like protein [Aureimonas leprariae]KAB0679344.1 Maf-like protein [Aureimonas leprariae]